MRFSYYTTYFVSVYYADGKNQTKEFKEHEDAKKYLQGFGKPINVTFDGRGDNITVYHYPNFTVRFGASQVCQVHPLEV